MSSFPSSFHSAASSMEQSMVWSPVPRVFRTAERTSSALVDCDNGLFSRAGWAATAGAAAPITTGVLLTAAIDGREDEATLSGESSDLGVPLRAESAAQGDPTGQGAAVASDFFSSDFWACDF